MSISADSNCSAIHQAVIFEQRHRYHSLLCGAVLACFIALLATRFAHVISTIALPSTDLGSHIEIIRQLALQLQTGRLIFYDHGWFGGWPAFQFYGFLAHLLSAAISIPAGWISPEPVRFTCQLLIYTGIVTLPLSMYYAAASLSTTGRARSTLQSIVLALFSGTVAVWFLYQSIPQLGIGASAILNFGLYTQLFGWHLLLINLGLLVNAIGAADRCRVNFRLLAGVIALLLTHPPSAVLFGFFYVFAVLYFTASRTQLVLTFALAAGVSAFWTLPFFVLLPDYTLAGTSHTDRHLIDLFLAAAGTSRATASISPWLQDPGPILFLLMALTWMLVREPQSSRYPAVFIFLIVLLGGLFGNNLFVSLLPVPLPYQRINGLLLLMILPVIAALAPQILAASRWPLMSAALLGLMAIVVSVNKVSLHNGPLNAVAQRQADDRSISLISERAVLDYFAQQRVKGRVFFEWFRGAGFPTTRQRFLESQLLQRTGFESANGLFSQSSPAYLYTVTTAMQLGAVTNAGYIDRQGQVKQTQTRDIELLDTPALSQAPSVAVQRLHAQGISHVVAGSQLFKARLNRADAQKLTDIGPYSIYQIGGFQPLQAAPYEPIGYIDLTGKLPLHYLAYYIDQLVPSSSPPELIELRAGKPVPAQLSRIIINGGVAAGDTRGQHWRATLGEREILQLNYRGQRDPSLRRLRNNDATSRTKKHYQKIKHYLNRILPRQPTFLANRPLTVAAEQPVLTWSQPGQQFTIAPMRSGQLTRIGYNFFPYWQADSGTFYRGGRGDIYYLSDNTTMTARFNNSGFRAVTAGRSLTAVSLMVLVWITIRRRRRGQSA